MIKWLLALLNNIIKMQLEDKKYYLLWLQNIDRVIVKGKSLIGTYSTIAGIDRFRIVSKR